MSSAPTQIAVASTNSANLVTTSITSAQIQKDYLDEPLARQNSLGNRSRAGLKGKHLTRSHAMRESTSPPRTPTPRSEQLSSASSSGISQSDNDSSLNNNNNNNSNSNNNNNNNNINNNNNNNNNINNNNNNSNTNNKMHVQSSSSTSTAVETPSVIVTSQHSQQSNYSLTGGNNIDTTNVICNDVDFPKLSPPKSSKNTRTTHNNNNNSSSNSNNNNNTNNTNNTNNNHNVTNNNNNNNNRETSSNLTDKQQQSGNEQQKNILDGTSNNEIYYTNNNNNNGGKKLNDKNPNNSTANNNRTDNLNQPISPSNSNHNNNNNTNNINNKNNNNNSNSNSNAQVNVETFTTNVETYNNSEQNSLNDNRFLKTDNTVYCQDENQNNNNNNLPDCSDKNNIGMDRSNKKQQQRNNCNIKNTKPRLKNMSGSSSSMEGGNSTSGFISRDSSTEQFTDQSGVDLIQFFKETLNKHPKDRSMLIKIEKDLIELAHDQTRSEFKFPAMGSYNRMLIHRVAAFFGMEHNVDQATQECVIVAPTKSTRIPDIRFKTLCRDRMSDEPKKLILKRDTHSFDDSRQSYLACPDRGILERKSKSFEEREEEYEKARRRIFRGRENMEMSDEQPQYWHWSNQESGGGGGDMHQSNRMKHNMKMLKVQTMSNDKSDGHGGLKSGNYSGYGGQQQQSHLNRGDSLNSNKSIGNRYISKQDSTGSNNQSWRLSPSSNGYKTQTQSLRSDSVTPSPTSYGSDDHTPEPPLIIQSPSDASSSGTASCGVVWAVTDMASVPRGSVLINPQTLQPIVNQDGSIYHYDPSNLPPGQQGGYNSNKNNAGVNTNVNRKRSDKTKNNYVKIDNVPQQQQQHQHADRNYSPNITTSEHSDISEISTQTLLNNESDIGKESTAGASQENIIVTRDINDIEEEIETNNHIEKSTLKIGNFPNSQKPKLINQATSPNIPSPEPDDINQQQQQSNQPSNTTNTAMISEGIKVKSTDCAQSTVTVNNSKRITPTTSATSATISTESKREELKSSSATLPLMTYATTGFQNIEGAVFQPGNPYGTTYQQGPDGSVYAVPGSGYTVYYPPPMESEIQGYFVYDQGTPRDHNGLISAGPAQGIYQPAGATPTAVVPVATYPTASFAAAAPLYQQQVVYTEQFPGTATAPQPGSAAAAQVQQYPLATYPFSYSYPYNGSGYWGQAMTYYVPQPTLANTVSSAIIPPPHLPVVGSALTGNLTNLSATINANTTNNMKRNSPPQHHNPNSSSGQNSQSNTPTINPTYQFSGPAGAAGVPIAFATTDPNVGPSATTTTMYAIPQSAVFQNMLPYATAAPTSSQTNPPAVINPTTTMISHGGGLAGPHSHHVSIDAGQLIATTVPPSSSSSSNHSANSYIVSSTTTANSNNRSGTPQSIPSTPLTTHPLSYTRNPPLFATPPTMISNAYNHQIPQTNYQTQQQNYLESQNLVATTVSNNSNNNNNAIIHEKKKNSYSVHNRNNNNLNTNNSGGPSSHNSSNRQITYSNQNQRKDTTNSYQHNSTNSRQSYIAQQNQQQKRFNNNHNTDNKPTYGTVLGTTSSTTTNLLNNSSIEKPRIRQKPGNLDFKRNGSQRNSPSTNSNESNNNSPNSISSLNHQHTMISTTTLNDPQQIQQQHQPIYMRGTHIPPMHHAPVVTAGNSAAAEVCHQTPIIGTYNHPAAPGGMYFKYGQTYFAHPSVPTLSSSRRSPPSDVRPSLPHLYPAVNMMLPAPRQMQPRQVNPNYKGNKPR